MIGVTSDKQQGWEEYRITVNLAIATSNWKLMEIALVSKSGTPFAHILQLRCWIAGLLEGIV